MSKTCSDKDLAPTLDCCAENWEGIRSIKVNADMEAFDENDIYMGKVVFDKEDRQYKIVNNSETITLKEPK